MKCPICQEKELVTQSLEDSYGKPDIFCPTVISLPGGKVVNHYRKYHLATGDKVRIFVWPYRIITWKNESRISADLTYQKSKKHYFKSILKIPALSVDVADKLKARIKLLILLS